MSPKPYSNFNHLIEKRKRKFSDAFIAGSVDDCRYNQHISADFFVTNGSDFTEEIKEIKEEKEVEIKEEKEEIVEIKEEKEEIVEVKEEIVEVKEETVVVFTVVEAQEILDWCAYYLANKNLFNV
jgi:predicted S18 family serine protease